MPEAEEDLVGTPGMMTPSQWIAALMHVAIRCFPAFSRLGPKVTFLIQNVILPQARRVVWEGAGERTATHICWPNLSTIIDPQNKATPRLNCPLMSPRTIQVLRTFAFPPPPGLCSPPPAASAAPTYHLGEGRERRAGDQACEGSLRRLREGPACQ